MTNQRAFRGLIFGALLIAPVILPTTSDTQVREGMPQQRGMPTVASKQGPLAPNPDTQQNAQDEVIRVDTNLVTVPTSVMDRSGRYVATLQKQDFHIYEDGVEQEIAYIAPLEQPITLAFVVDVSASTRERLLAIADAANIFLGNLRDEDRIFVVSFDSHIRVLIRPIEIQKIREDHQQIILKHGDSTHLYDAVDFILNKSFKHITGRKAMILFTDGFDYTSYTSYKSNLHDAEESDVLIYPVQYNSLSTTLQLMEISSQYRHSLHLSKEQVIKSYELPDLYLHSLAEKSGGRYFDADTLAEMQQTFRSITEELRHQYTLGYYPRKLFEPGQRRRITVQVQRQDVVVRARDSYVVDKDRVKGK